MKVLSVVAALTLGATLAVAAPTVAHAQTASEWAAAKYGTFTPATFTGTGSSVIPLPAGAKSGTLTASYSGAGNFIVWTLDSLFGDEELVFNEIGAYQGVAAYGTYSFYQSATYLEVTAAGPWTISLAPLASAPVAGTALSGTTSGVYLFAGAAGVATFTYPGSRYFGVFTFGDSGSDLLVNNVGSYSGSVAIKAGPRVLVVDVTGAGVTWNASLPGPSITVNVPPAPAAAAAAPVVAPSALVTPRIKSNKKGAVGVSWKAPASSGSSPILEYRVTIKRAGKLVKQKIVDADRRSVTFKKLKRKAKYVIQVRATNQEGRVRTSPKVSVRTR